MAPLAEQAIAQALAQKVIRAAGLLFFACVCQGQQDPVPAEANWIARDFPFAAGKRSAELRLHYITLGKPVRDAAGRVNNAVLILHDTASSAQPFLASGFLGALFLPGQPLDAAKVLRHPAGRHRPRRFQQAERRPAREVPRTTMTTTWCARSTRSCARAWGSIICAW